MPGKIWIHIEFENGSNPKVYFKKTFTEACDILREWEKNWDLKRIPSDPAWPDIWYFWAKERVPLTLAPPSPKLRSEHA